MHVNINSTAPKYHTDNGFVNSELMSQTSIGRVLPQLNSEQEDLAWNWNGWTVFATISIKDLTIRPKVQGRESRELVEFPLGHHVRIVEPVVIIGNTVRPPVYFIHFSTFSFRVLVHDSQFVPFFQNLRIVSDICQPFWRPGKLYFEHVFIIWCDNKTFGFWPYLNN